MKTRWKVGISVFMGMIVSVMLLTGCIEINHPVQEPAYSSGHTDGPTMFIKRPSEDIEQSVPSTHFGINWG